MKRKILLRNLHKPFKNGNGWYMMRMNLEKVRDYGNPDCASTALNKTNGRYMSGHWREDGFHLIRFLPIGYEPKPYKVGENLFDPHHLLP